MAPIADAGQPSRLDPALIAMFTNHQPFASHHRATGSSKRRTMRFPFKRLRGAQHGATAIEYAMVAFFISIAAFSVLVTVGSNVTGLFSSIASSF
jgi:Flp pilus assembly pilin Flp